MNKILLSLIFLALTLNAQPSWFYNIKTKNNEIIGYGVSNDLYEAKKYAIDEISKTLDLNINSSYDIKKSYKKDVLVKKEISSNINIKSRNNLQDIYFRYVKKIDNQWYVAAVYDNSTLIQKVQSRLKNNNLRNEKQNFYLEKSPLIKSLNKELNYKLNFEIIRKNELWYLSYKNYLFHLEQNDFYELFYDYKNDLIVSTNKITFEDNEQIKLTIQSKKDSFITIFNIQFDGKIGILMKNQKINNQKIIDEFKTINPYNKQIQEQFIAIESEKPIDLNNYTDIDMKLLNENDFKLAELLKLLNNYNYSSKTIKINKGY